MALICSCPVATICITLWVYIMLGLYVMVAYDDTTNKLTK